MYFIYENDKKVVDEYKAVVKSEKTSLANVARTIGITPQQMSNKFLYKHIPLDELSAWLDVLDYDLVLDFRPRKK